MTDAISPADIVHWQAEVEEAEKQRNDNPEAMDIYRPKVTKASTMREIEVQLSERELQLGDASGQATWLAKGIQTEQSQHDVRAFARRLHVEPTVPQRQDLVRRRQTLRKSMDNFLKGAVEFMGIDLVNAFNDEHIVPILDGAQTGDEAEIANDTILYADPERQLLCFPSEISPQLMAAAGTPPHDQLEILRLREKELRIRKAHADDLLESIRGAIIQKAWLFRYEVRRTEGTQRTRAQSRVSLLAQSIIGSRRKYNDNRQVMFSLTQSNEERQVMEQDYPKLTKQDVNDSSAITEENARGGSRARLSWLWSVNRMPPAMHNADVSQQQPLNDQRIADFNRIHWLRARAQKMRWQEEVELCQHEMEWTIRHYMYMARMWRARRDMAMLPGGVLPNVSAGSMVTASTQLARHTLGFAAYASAQMAMWNELGHIADGRFAKSYTQYRSVWELVQ